MPPNLSSAPSSSGKSSRKTCFVSKHRTEREEHAVACTAERWRRRRHALQLSSIILPATPRLLLSYCHPLSIPAVPKPFYLQIRSAICSPTSNLGVLRGYETSWVREPEAHSGLRFPSPLRPTENGAAFPASC